MTHRHGIGAMLAAAGAMLGGTASGAAPAVPPTVIGVNISPPSYFHQSRAFANMAIGSSWGASNKQPLGDGVVDADGNLKQLPSDLTFGRMLTPPNQQTRKATIRCTWQGKGDLRPMAHRGENVRAGANSLTFDVSTDPRLGRIGSIPLKMTPAGASDPLRNLDCRETTIPADARFDPQFVESLKGFRILRFMDWQRTNFNQPVSWATRTTPRSIDVMGGDGVAIEDMVALAKQVGADPWFNMPWNADDDYIRHFAQLVHDTLPERTVYVELGNELWNLSFQAAKQSMREGQEEGLSSNLQQAGQMRYAEKLSHVMDIWTKVYADRPNRLVRVAACQNGAACAKTVLGFRDTARHVDALATAPYFGAQINKANPTTPDQAFAMMNPEIDRVIDLAVRAKEVAAQHGKRYIAYESGQHLLLKDMALQQAIQRDPRMYDAYKYYLDSWRTKLGDAIVLYYSAGPIARSGAWGLSEGVGQPIADAPKLRAVREEMDIAQPGRSAH